MYNHVNVTLTPGQINKLKSKYAASTDVSITLKNSQLGSGQNKISVTQTQLNQINKAKSTGKGIRLDFSAAAIRDMIKSGGIFPLIPILAAALPGALSAAGKAAALGAVGTAAGMAAKKALGGKYSKRGERIPIGNILSTLPSANNNVITSLLMNPQIPLMNKLAPFVRPIVDKAMKLATGKGYKKKQGRGLRLPGTLASWYPKR